MRGERFETLQFHFHSLSEHFLFGEQFDLELHLVHRSAAGDLLVIGRFVVPGDRLEELDEVIAAIEVGGGFEVKDFDLDVFIPSRRTSYRYRGSTTTPPCTEGVQWILMTEPLELSEDQIERIQLALQDINEGFDNARPLLSRNGRPILTDARRRPMPNDDYTAMTAIEPREDGRTATHRCMTGGRPGFERDLWRIREHWKW